MRDGRIGVGLRSRAPHPVADLDAAVERAAIETAATDGRRVAS